MRAVWTEVIYVSFSCDSESFLVDLSPVVLARSVAKLFVRSSDAPLLGVTAAPVSELRQ